MKEGEGRGTKRGWGTKRMNKMLIYRTELSYLIVMEERK